MAANPDVSKPFADGVKALLTAALPTGTDVYVGRPDRADDMLTYPYLVLWVIPSTAVRVSLSGAVQAADCRLQITGVGLSTDEVVTVLDRATWALVGRRVPMDGWSPGQVREMPVHQPVTKNEDLWFQGQPTYRSWAMFRMSAERAPATVES